MSGKEETRPGRGSRPFRDALEPVMSTGSAYLSGVGQTLAIGREVVSLPFKSELRRSESIRMIGNLAPQLMSTRGLLSGGSTSSSALTYPRTKNPSIVSSLPSSLLHPNLNLLRSRQPQTSTSLAILEQVPQLLTLNPAESDSPDHQPHAQGPSLFQAFKATRPASELAKQRRRRVRSGVADSEVGASPGGKIGLKRLGDKARGLLTDIDEDGNGADGEAGGDQELSLMDKRKRRRRQLKHGRGSSGAGAGAGQAGRNLSMEELARQADEIAVDKENLHVRQELIISEIDEIHTKMNALETIRNRLENSLTLLQEEDLELDDELEGIRENMMHPAITNASGGQGDENAIAGPSSSKSSRRRKGPAFLPSEHDDLPSGVAFMTLAEHAGPITALDFSEPYGTLVTAGQDDVVKVWDLCDGETIGELRGHDGMVKVVQVEEDICLTGGADGSVRLWDLRLVEDWEEKVERREREEEIRQRDPLAREDEEGRGLVQGEIEGEGGPEAEAGPCVRVLEGHSKAVTALYYEEGCLVTGSSDKTIRQWDANTGQCVLTMDILWAIAHPPAPPPSSPLKPTNIPPMDSPYNSPTRPRIRGRASTYFSNFGGGDMDDMLPSPGGGSFMGLPGSGILSAASGGAFAVPTPPYSDGSWEMYQDFVGGVQFWGYALVSGSGDGGVRMWDMRTGQAHRTLIGHTGPVTCVQFDESYIISGSLDKTVKTWDLRMGSAVETLRYEYPVTALQFDSRKIVTCTGENGIDTYNRISGQHSRLVVNGHTKPAERLRFMDKYLVSGGKDGVAKIWAL